MRVLTPSTGATTARGMVAPCAVRPVSLPSTPSLPVPRRHRGRRSVAARLRRCEAWRARPERVDPLFHEEAEPISSNDVFAAPAGWRAPLQTSNDRLDNAEGSRRQDVQVEVVNVPEGNCDDSSPGRTGQSSPSTLIELTDLGNHTFIAVAESLDKTTELLDLTEYHRVSPRLLRDCAF